MQQTIYFQKDIWEKLSQEDKKSTLINNLLRSHYDVTQHKTVSKPSVVTQRKTDDDTECPRHHVSYDLCKSKH